MKSFFKKVALLLVLAMVVTMLPAKAASAADTEGPLMRSYMKLYINGDITETYSDHANAWVSYDKETYKVTFASEDENVATVGEWGRRVTAVGVGRTNITATFTDRETGDTITRKCVVDVKRNALEVAMSANTQKTLEEGIEVGTTFQTVASRTNADGTVTWKKAKVTKATAENEKERAKWAIEGVTTSALVFESSDEKVFTVDKYGKVTAVGLGEDGKGEAELSVWAVQSEKPDKDEEGKTVYKRVTEIVTYPVKVLAGTIASVKQTTADAFEITCTNETVASLLNANNLSVAYVSNGIDIQTFVKSVAVKDDDHKAVVVVTMHNPIDAGVTYKVTYDKKTLEFVGVEPTPHHIAIDAKSTQVEVGKETEIKVLVYTENDIDITAVADVAGHVTISAPESTDYSITGRSIYFFETNKSVTVKAVYEMGWDEQGNKITNPDTTAVITSYTVTDGNIAGWLVAKTTEVGDKNTKEENFGSTVATLAVGDPDFALYGMYKRSNGDVRYTVNDGNSYTYESTNTNVLMVGFADGLLYPIAAGSASVIVKRGTTVVGVCPITIVASRDFNTLTAKADKDKLSKGSNPADTVTVTLEVKDQLGADIKGYTVVANQVATSDDKEIAVATWDGNNKVIITPGKDASATPRTVYIKIEVTANGVTKPYNVQVSVKNVTGASPYSYKIKVDRTSVDTKLETGKYAKGEYDATIRVDYFDRDGYYLGTKEGNDLTYVSDPNKASTANDAYSFIVTKNNTAVAVSGTSLQTVTVSGSSEFVKKEIGDYIVRVYRGNGTSKTAQLVGSATINVKDTTTAITVEVSSQSVNDIMDALTFKRGKDDVDKTTLKLLKADSTPTVSGTFVRTVTIAEKIDGYDYVIVVPVNKFVNVTSK